MARDLSFWKVSGEVQLSNAEVYQRLSCEQHIEGIQELPINEIMETIYEKFCDWKRDGMLFEFLNQSFEIMVTSQFIRFDCFSVSEENMNKMIDLMLEYECPLYDSAIDIRFD